MRPSYSFRKFLIVEMVFLFFFFLYLSIKMCGKEVGILYVLVRDIKVEEVIVNFDGNLIRVSTWFHFKYFFRIIER